MSRTALDQVETEYFDGNQNSPLDLQPFSAQNWVETTLNPRIQEALQDNHVGAYDKPLILGNTEIKLLNPAAISRYTGFLANINAGWYPHEKGHFGNDGVYYEDLSSTPGGVVLGRFYPNEREVYESIESVNTMLVLLATELQNTGNLESVDSIQVVGSNVMTAYQPGESDLDIILILNSCCTNIDQLMDTLRGQDFVNRMQEISEDIRAECIQIFLHIPLKEGTWGLNALVCR